MLLYCTHLAYYDINPVSEKEITTPEKIDQGGPGHVSKYLRHHRDDEEKTLERVLIVIY